MVQIYQAVISHQHSLLLMLGVHLGLFVCVAERGEERAAAVPGSQDLCQILQDVGDDVYQQYRLTRQGSDFDSQSAFHINVRVNLVLYILCKIYQIFVYCISYNRIP